MERSLGLTFLVLSGLLVYAVSETGTTSINSSSTQPTTDTTLTTKATDMITPSPPRTSSLQHQQTNTTTDGTATKMSTPSPPRNSSHQHQQTNTTTDGTATNMITPSPPRNSSHQHQQTNTTTTTDGTASSWKCEFVGNVTETGNEFQVKLKSNDSQKVNQICSVKHSNSIYNVSLNNGTCHIPMTILRPSEHYNISFHSKCNISFKTRLCDIQDIVRLDWDQTHSKFCFQTKWNMEDMNSCLIKKDSGYSFKESSCNQNKELILLENFTFIKNITSSLNRTEMSHNIHNVTFKCNFRETNIEENEPFYLEPYKPHSCTPMYLYEVPKIPVIGKTFLVYFACEVELPKLSATNNTIEASWNFISTNCNNTKFAFKVKCGQELNEMCEISSANRSCNMTSLNYFSDYTCTITTNYNAHVTKKDQRVRTQAGVPVILELNVKIVENSADVRYDIDWRGTPGTCYLWLSKVMEKNKPMENKGSKKSCSFHVPDLYYLTSYSFEVYAKNQDGYQSDRKSTDHSTPYNSKAVLGFLGFLIVVTSLALLLVMYKIFVLQRKQSREACEMHHLLPPETLLHVEPIASDALIETYRKKIADEGRLFMDEFQSIPRIFSNYTVKEAKKSDNQSKNRYVDILPYDYNRVSLSNGGRSDYINASFIEGYKEPKKYIAAQGPKEETVEDFWRMVWEQKSSIIVMVTRCEEGNKNKCAQYWPSMERETEIFEEFVVKIKHEETCPDYMIRQLSLMNKKEKTAERDVTHIQFISWPDHGVPGDPSLLLKLRRRVNSFKNIFSGPIVVHCSAGVGRTGTYIGIDAMIESLEAEGRVDIYGYVAKLRRQRCLMVQVEAQYILIHTALIEYSQFGETEISLMDFHSRVNTLKQRDGNESSLLELEYQKLPKFKNWRASNTAVAEENRKKNRSSVVPYDFNRVLVKLEEEEGHNDDEDDYSSDEDDDSCTKYINASYVDGYWGPKSLITAQGPLANTVEDFLQMLFQGQVPVVIMLTDCTESDKEFCTQYWAEEKTTFGEMEVEVKETESTATYIRRRLQIQSTKNKGSILTEQYHFLQWVGQELPANPLDLIDMMKGIRQTVGHSKNTSSPIVVHCSDGSSRSGIFCALWKLLDSADTEKLVDVFQVVKSMRKERLGMFSTLEQYQFLYEALHAAFPLQNGEVKKTAASTDSVEVVNEESPTTSADKEEVTANNQAPENQTIPSADTASSPPAEGASESSSAPEKAPSESTTNGPTVTVEL